MNFDDVLEQVREQLEREKRVAYRMLKRRFELNEEDLEDLKADLIDAKQLARDEDGKVLVWTGVSPVPSSTSQEESSKFQVSGSKLGLRTPDTGLLPIWPNASWLNRPHWKPVAQAMGSARSSPRCLPTSKAPPH